MFEKVKKLFERVDRIEKIITESKIAKLWSDGDVTRIVDVSEPKVVNNITYNHAEITSDNLRCFEVGCKIEGETTFYQVYADRYKYYLEDNYVEFFISEKISSVFKKVFCVKELFEKEMNGPIRQ